MRRFDITFIFVLLPLSANAFLAISAFFGHPGDFHANLEACWAVIAFALLTASAAFWGFAVHDLGPKRTMLSLLGQGAALIFVFGGVYRGYGLLYGGSASHCSMTGPARSTFRS